MSTPYLPINLRLDDRPIVVVGGGAVAAQKVRVLLASGACIRVVAPWVGALINEQPRLEVRRVAFTPEALDGARAAIAATDDPVLNQQVYDEAHRRGLLVNVVDDPERCDFIFPSILRRGELAVAVSTGGASPSLARLIRQELEAGFRSDYGAILSLARHTRGELRRRIACPGARRAAAECLARWARAARVGGDVEAISLRIDALILELSASTPRTIITQPPNATLDPTPDLTLDPTQSPSQSGDELVSLSPVGRITLVGAGPGDPDLITVAGVKALTEADVVVYDRLVNPQLLHHAPRADHIYVGKAVGEPHGATQQRINDLITGEARRGRRVVRLKGGDPYVFGRGGEEVLAARAAGLPCRVIPGISAALGAAAGSDIPLTHRDLASSVAFVTGCAAAPHGRQRPGGGYGGEDESPGLDWRLLARAVDTIVIYMGVQNLAGIAGQLREGGRPESEPVAIIHNATLLDQEVAICSLGDLARGINPEMPAPSIVIVGQVVRLRESLQQLVEAAASAG